jgi:hypothetical protein
MICGQSWSNFGIAMMDTFGLNQFAPTASNIILQINPSVLDFSLQQAKCERKRQDRRQWLQQGWAPGSHDNNNNFGIRHPKDQQQKWRGNRLPQATITSGTMATNNGSDGNEMGWDGDVGTINDGTSTGSLENSCGWSSVRVGNER